jgi:hypothetical protein
VSVFFKDGQFVNEDGQVTDANGVIIQAQLPPSDLQAEVLQLNQETARLAELQGEGTDLGDPESQDSRTNAQLQAALTTGGIPFDPKYNRASLQALAKEHNL